MMWEKTDSGEQGERGEAQGLRAGELPSPLDMPAEGWRGSFCCDEGRRREGERLPSDGTGAVLFSYTDVILSL